LLLPPPQVLSRRPLRPAAIFHRLDANRHLTSGYAATFKFSDTLLKSKPFLQRAEVGVSPIFYL
jgi:hypothetical protein